MIPAGTAFVETGLGWLVGGQLGGLAGAALSDLISSVSGVWVPGSIGFVETGLGWLVGGQLGGLAGAILSDIGNAIFGIVG